MAVSVAGLAAYLGIESRDSSMSSELQELIDTADAIIEEDAPDAPAHIKNLATRRWAAYQHDQPFAARGSTFANAYVNSGAGAVLSRWRIRRL